VLAAVEAGRQVRMEHQKEFGRRFVVRFGLVAVSFASENDSSSRDCAVSFAREKKFFSNGVNVRKGLGGAVAS